MIPLMQRMREAPRRGVLLAAALSVLPFAGCFFILHGTMSPPSRAVFHVESDCSHLYFSADSTTLVTAGSSLSYRTPVQVWDVATGRLRYEVAWEVLRRRAKVPLDQVLLSPDSRLLALRNRIEGIVVYDLQTGKELAHREGDFAHYLDFGFALDGRYLAIQGNDRIDFHVDFWDPRTQTIIAQIKGAFPGGKPASHGRDLATYVPGDQGTVKILLWRLPDSGPPVLTKEMLVSTQHVAFTPDLSRFATYAPNDVPQIALWDTATGRKLCSLADEPRTYVQDFYFPVEGQLLVVVEGFSRTRGLSPRWGTPTWHLAPPPIRTAVLWTTEPLQYSVAGKWLALPQGRGALLIDVDTGEERELQARFDEKRLVYLLGGTHPALSPNSELLAVAGLCKRLRDPLPNWLPDRLIDFLDSSVCETHFWDTATGQEHSSILPGSRALFSPDGQTLLTLDEDHTIRLWDFPLRRPLARDLELSALLWLMLIVLVGVGRVFVRMIFRLGR